MGRRSFTPLSALSHGSDDEYFSAASPNPPSPENSALQSSENSALQLSENTTVQSSERPDSPSPEMNIPPPVRMLNPLKRRRNSDSVVRDTPVARDQFLAQAFMLGSSSTAAYVFGSCVSVRRPFEFRVPHEEARQYVNVDTLGDDEARPNEGKSVADVDREVMEELGVDSLDHIDGEPIDDIDGEPFEDESTDDE